jgi:hypothetical protein
MTLCIWIGTPPLRRIAIQQFVKQTIDRTWHVEKAGAAASEAEKMNRSAGNTVTDSHCMPIPGDVN